VWGRGGRRTVPMADFVLGPYATALEEGEVITAIRVPRLPAGAAMAHRKICFHERPAVTVTCMVRRDNGAVADARIAVGSVGLAPARLAAAERALADGAAVERIEALAREECAPTEDSSGAIDYKRHLVGGLVRRTADEALLRAGAAA